MTKFSNSKNKYDIKIDNVKELDQKKLYKRFNRIHKHSHLLVNTINNVYPYIYEMQKYIKNIYSKSDESQTCTECCDFAKNHLIKCNIHSEKDRIVDNFIFENISNINLINENSELIHLFISSMMRKFSHLDDQNIWKLLHNII